MEKKEECITVLILKDPPLNEKRAFPCENE